MADKLTASPKTRTQHHITFFRQSGWMMLATVLGGALMYALHRVASRMPKDEYGLFTTLLQMVNQMGIPAIGLQGVFAQQAAASLNPEHEKELAGVFRGVLYGTFSIWLVMAAAIWVFRGKILLSLGIANPAALWVTTLVGLTVLWRPLVLGIMQGRQNFLWFGWSSILDGVVRFLGVCIIVGLLAAYAAGAMTAVLFGCLMVIGIGGWFSRDCLVGPTQPMNWRAWLARIVPLGLGLGVGTFMLTADMLFVRALFSKEQTGYYAAAGMIGRALVYFTAPLTTVMFPKLARSAALGERSQALLLALGLTALTGTGAAVVCSIFPRLPLSIVYDRSFLAVSAPLVPWFAWCMLPLTLANVLLYSLMARSCYAAVPWLLCVAIGYGAALCFWHDTFKMVIQIIGIFGLILLGVCAWFSFHGSNRNLETTDAG